MDITIHLIIGPLMILMGLIFKLFPPKKINDFYGYRTNRSKLRQEIWDEANSYSPKLIVWVGVITTIAQVVFYYTLEFETGMGAAAAVLVVLLLCTIPMTETHLNKMFDQNGNRKEHDHK
jgi:uncharacterized membrane protein